QLFASRALATRDSTRRLVERIAAMAELERTAPRWSAVLSRVAIALRADAEVSSIWAESDSVIVDGHAKDVSRVLAGFQRTPGVKATRTTSAILHAFTDH